MEKENSNHTCHSYVTASASCLSKAQSYLSTQQAGNPGSNSFSAKTLLQQVEKCGDEYQLHWTFTYLSRPSHPCLFQTPRGPVQGRGGLTPCHPFLATSQCTKSIRNWTSRRVLFTILLFPSFKDLHLVISCIRGYIHTAVTVLSRFLHPSVCQIPFWTSSWFWPQQHPPATSTTIQWCALLNPQHGKVHSASLALVRQIASVNNCSPFTLSTPFIIHLGLSAIFSLAIFFLELRCKRNSSALHRRCSTTSTISAALPGPFGTEIRRNRCKGRSHSTKLELIIHLGDDITTPSSLFSVPFQKNSNLPYVFDHTKNLERSVLLKSLWLI